MRGTVTLGLLENLYFVDWTETLESQGCSNFFLIELNSI